MNKKTKVRNDGNRVFVPQEIRGRAIKLTFRGETIEFSLEAGFELNADYSVQPDGCISSDPHDRDFIVSQLEALGFEYEDDDPRTRVQHLRNEHGDLVVNWETILKMWELRDFVRPANYIGWEGYEWAADGLVYQITLGRRHPEVNPYDAREVRREAQILIQAARRWIHKNLRSFKRVVKLSDYEAVRLHKIATSRKTAIIGVRSGETKTIRRMSGQKFGSGGGWARWEIFGEVTEGDIVSDRSNKFVDDYLVEVTFDQGPAVLYTAAGDGINEGRLHYKVLYVVDPSGDLAVSAAPESR